MPIGIPANTPDFVAKAEDLWQLFPASEKKEARIKGKNQESRGKNGEPRIKNQECEGKRSELTT